MQKTIQDFFEPEDGWPRNDVIPFKRHRQVQVSLCPN